MTGTEFLGLGAVFGVVAASWEKIKATAHRCFSLFVVTMQVQDRAAYAFTVWLLRNMRRSPLCDIHITGKNEYVRPKARNQVVAFRRLSSKATVYWRGWRCLTVSRSWNNLNIHFIRWMFDPHKLVLEAVENFNEAEAQDADRSRFFVRRMQGTIGESDIKSYIKGGKEKDAAATGEENSSDTGDPADRYNSEILGWKFDDIGQPHNTRAIHLLSLSDEVLEACERVRQWRQNELWFKERQIPWKYGLGFEGIPGSGKTATARALAQENNMPIFMFDLPTMTNQDLVEAWTDARDWVPCMVLFEDLDAVFDGRKNVADMGMQAKLTFDCFLNILDGVENSEGMLVVITTNSIEKIDSALSGNGQGSRPGRINHVIHFTHLTDAGKKKMATRILAGLPEERWGDILNHGGMYTGAQFQELCCERALELWESRTTK